MRIIVSFDTEDFTDAYANDVLLRIAEALTERGVRAGFGLVGEKARFIGDLGRYDVVEALKEHDICYHTDNHFLFPDPLVKPAFMSEYVEERSWDEAVRHLVATEAEGLRDIEELFGRRPTTYFRTGGDSAAQVLYAYHLLGLRTFAYGLSPDEWHGKPWDARHLAPQPGSPPAPRWKCVLWFVNMLCVSLPIVRESDTYSGRGPSRLDEFARQGADLINVRFHPCMFFTEAFWSNVNFRGRPRVSRFGPYELAPHLPEEETASRIRRMCELVDYARETHDAQFTTYDALTAEAKLNPPWLGRPTVVRLARAVLERLSYTEVDGHYYSLAEAFAAIVWAWLHPDAARVPYRRVIGPVDVPSAGEFTQSSSAQAGLACRERSRTARPGENDLRAGQDPPGHTPSGESFEVSDEDVLEACRQAERHLAAYRRVPAEVGLKGRLVRPAALLRLAAKRLTGVGDLRAEPAPLYPEGFDDVLSQWDNLGHELIGFFPDRGRDTKRMKQAVKLQYWSYKPATDGG